MCRLCAMTESTGHPFLRAAVLDRIMLLGNADVTPQRDGWGVTDGTEIFKAAHSYRQYLHAPWMESLDPKKMWLGHVRAASSGTAYTDDAAHPYKFPHFVGIHNGNFKGTWRVMENKAPENAINTDTWRAFHLLNAMLDEGKLLENCVDEWASLFDDDSEFVVMLLHNQQLHVIRGPKTRHLFYGKYGNGFVFHTDEVVLKSMNSWCSYMFGKGVEEIEEFPEIHYARLNQGTHTFEEMRALKYEPHVSKQATYINNTWTTAAQNTANLRQTAERGKWIRMTRMHPGNKEDTEKLIAWSKLWQQMYPLRQGLGLWYTAELLRKHVDCTIVNLATPKTYKDLEVAEYEAAFEYMKLHPFTNEQRKIIHIWNNKVAIDEEITVFDLMFNMDSDDVVPFWLLSNGEDIVKELQ